MCCGLHTHCSPIRPGETRVAHCHGNFFVPDNAPRSYVLDLQEGPAPIWLRNALRYPLGDIAIAAERIGHLAQQYASTGEPVPTREDVKAASRSLRRCGDFRGAHMIEAHFVLPTTRALMRERNVEFWIDPIGKEIREAILQVLRACWIRHGGQASGDLA